MNHKSIVIAGLIAATATLALAQTAMPGMPLGKGPADEGFMKAMMRMHSSMQSMKPTGEADKDFVMMMKPHHQAAIDMAKVEIQYGKDEMIKKMAQDIIIAQEKEIADMSAWQSKNGI